MIRNNEQALIAKSKPLTLLRYCNHCICLACADNVTEKLVAAIKTSRNGVELVLSKLYLRVYSG